MPEKGQTRRSPRCGGFGLVFLPSVTHFGVICTCRTLLHSSCCSPSVCVNICHCMCPPVLFRLVLCHPPFLSHPLPPSIPPSLPPSLFSLHHFFFFLSVWVSMRSDPGELITVGAGVAWTKTLHRQHNSGSRNQTGSTQPSQTGPAQISSAQPSHAHRSRNAVATLSSAGLRACRNHNNCPQYYVVLAGCWIASFVSVWFNTRMLCFCFSFFSKS